MLKDVSVKKGGTVSLRSAFRQFYRENHCFKSTYSVFCLEDELIYNIGL